MFLFGFTVPMRYLKQFTILIFLLLTAVTASARERSLKDVIAGLSYVSTTERYSIALPRVIDYHRQIEKTGFSRDGKSTETSWFFTEGIIGVSRTDYDHPVLAREQTLSQYAAIEKKILAEYYKSAKLVKESLISLDENKGYELIYSSPTRKYIRRTFIVGNFEYFAEAVVYSDVPGAEKLMTAALDSLRIIAPYSDKRATAHSDRREQLLKGPVRSVVTELEVKGVSPRQKEFEEYFDRITGNITRQIRFREGKLHTDRNVLYDPKTGIRTSSQVEFHFNSKEFREMSYFDSVVSHDNTGQVTGEIDRDRDGKLLGRQEYIFKGDRETGIVYDKDDKKTYSAEFTIDEKGFLAQVVSTNFEKEPVESTVDIYTYNSYDKQGNWTMRTVTSKNNSYIQYQTITYWE